MDRNQPNDSQNAAESGDVQNDSESFRTIPKASESFGTVRNDSARFGNVPHPSERKQNHTLTVREAARMFEAAGVARTERSIVNWCQPNRQGIPRLDSYFDPNERRYYITPESVEMAIAEEKARAAKINEPSERFGTVPDDAETPQFATENEPAQTRELELQIRDLEITNRVKDQVIGMKDKFIEQLQQEQRNYIERLIDSSHRIGQLEAKLLEIESPSDSEKGDV
ncbi:MAG TPA: hypothetical protein VGY98_01605 [Verrucomicrobiae bacterium]|nr:hypothetical protein [Verrucomicrobiae bacterium]